jgi:hypothetical protein
MNNKELGKATITDLFEHMLESGESKTIIEAIRKERGNETAVKSESEQLTDRKNILKNLTKK